MTDPYAAVRAYLLFCLELDALLDDWAIPEADR